MGMTTPHALHWDILRWNFEVEHVDMMLRHNVEYRRLPCKTLSSGPKVARFCEGVNKAPQGDYSTTKQNRRQSANVSLDSTPKSSAIRTTTFATFAVLHLLSLLLTMIWTAFSRYCRGRSERPGSGLPTLLRCTKHWGLSLE